MRTCKTTALWLAALLPRKITSEKSRMAAPTNLSLSMPPVRSYKSIPNDFIADYVAQYHGRAVGFSSVDPNDPTSAEEFERSVTDLKLQGLKLSPVYQGFDPWSPRAWELYHIANKYDIPVMFHMGGMYDPNGTLEWGHVLRLDKVGRAFPDLRIIVAHFGQPNMQETSMLMRKNKNVYTDLSARFRA